MPPRSPNGWGSQSSRFLRLESAATWPAALPRGPWGSTPPTMLPRATSWRIRCLRREPISLCSCAASPTKPRAASRTEPRKQTGPQSSWGPACQPVPAPRLVAEVRELVFFVTDADADIAAAGVARRSEFVAQSSLYAPHVGAAAAAAGGLG